MVGTWIWNGFYYLATKKASLCFNFWGQAISGTNGLEQNSVAEGYFRIKFQNADCPTGCVYANFCCQNQRFRTWLEQNGWASCWSSNKRVSDADSTRSKNVRTTNWLEQYADSGGSMNAKSYNSPPGWLVWRLVPVRLESRTIAWSKHAETSPRHVFLGRQAGSSRGKSRNSTSVKHVRSAFWRSAFQNVSSKVSMNVSREVSAFTIVH